MITLAELLEDKTYREYFKTKPQVTGMARLSPPWRVMIQRKAGGPWGRKDFWTYAQAFNFLRKHLPKVHDATIQSKGVQYEPPVRMVRIKGKFVTGSDGVERQATKRVPWEPKLPLDEYEEHHWCPYCRRPTVFKWFSKHHAIGEIHQTHLKRCAICGASENLVPMRRKR